MPGTMMTCALVNDVLPPFALADGVPILRPVIYEDSADATPVTWAWYSFCFNLNGSWIQFFLVGCGGCSVLAATARFSAGRGLNLAVSCEDETEIISQLDQGRGGDETYFLVH